MPQMMQTHSGGTVCLSWSHSSKLAEDHSFPLICSRTPERVQTGFNNVRAKWALRGEKWATPMKDLSVGKDSVGQLVHELVEGMGDRIEGTTPWIPMNGWALPRDPSKH